MFPLWRFLFSGAGGVVATTRVKPENRKKIGRPTMLTEKLREKLFELVKMGLSDRAIAKACDISQVTLKSWKKDPNFLTLLNELKAAADGEVKKALYLRALGYSHTEEKVFNNNGQILRAKTTKHYPPDTEAAKFWLINRQKQEWSNKQTIEFPDELNIKVTIGGQKDDDQG
jgi:hypothetical protein